MAAWMLIFSVDSCAVLCDGCNLSKKLRRSSRLYGEQRTASKEKVAAASKFTPSGWVGRVRAKAERPVFRLNMLHMLNPHGRLDADFQRRQLCSLV